jgi:hypothetical protein
MKKLARSVSAMASKSKDVMAPKRLSNGVLDFEDAPDFRPNLTPEEVLQRGSFGGSYFRDLTSGITGESYTGVWKELPKSWLEGLDIKEQVASQTYRAKVNAYGVNCGVKAGKEDPFGLLYWESKNWIEAQDPYGWFQWYCRFFQGRRTDDDERQISRWKRCAGSLGRWRSNLITKVMNARATFDDEAVSPVVRQTLQHWAYRLSDEDYESGVQRKRASATAVLSAAEKQKQKDEKTKSKGKGKAKVKREVKVEADAESESELPRKRRRVKRE